MGLQPDQTFGGADPSSGLMASVLVFSELEGSVQCDHPHPCTCAETEAPSLPLAPTAQGCTGLNPCSAEDKLCDLEQGPSTLWAFQSSSVDQE